MSADHSPDAQRFVSVANARVSTPPAPDRVISFEEYVDADAVAVLLEQVAEAHAHGRVVIDLSAVTVFATPTVSVFCRALRQATRAGASLALTGGPPHVRRAVALCAIDGVELTPARAERP